ncbi:MAG: DNA methyltransferase, partial [Archaeoglobaceae archaeon]
CVRVLKPYRHMVFFFDKRKISYVWDYLESLGMKGRSPHDLVLDPFCGSGTVLVVAKKLGRSYIGIDIDPKYCEIAKNRLLLINGRLYDL